MQYEHLYTTLQNPFLVGLFIDLGIGHCEHIINITLHTFCLIVVQEVLMLWTSVIGQITQRKRSTIYVMQSQNNSTTFSKVTIHILALSLEDTDIEKILEQNLNHAPWLWNIIRIIKRDVSKSFYLTRYLGDCEVVVVAAVVVVVVVVVVDVVVVVMVTLFGFTVQIS